MLKIDDYISIKVPGLAESRPSILIGDTVLVKNVKNLKK